MFQRRALLALIPVVSLVPAVVQSQEMPRNASVTRVAEGRYENRNTVDGALIGTESFRLTVFADGSRCLSIWSNSANRGTQITSQVCVDSNFRPIEASARYWIGGQFRGSGWLRVSGATLVLVSANANGVLTTTTQDVPAKFSVGTHPISGDAWHVAALGDAESVKTATSYTFTPAGSGSEPLVGSLVSIPVERLGTESIEVPAGKFTARKLRLSGQTTYWAADGDWLVVKASSASTERVLVSFSQSQ